MSDTTKVNALIDRAKTLAHDLNVDLEGVTNGRRRDEIQADYESDALSLVQEIAKLAD